MISSKKGTWNAYPPPPFEHPLTPAENWWMVHMIHFLLNMFSSLGHQGEQKILTTPEAEVEAKQAALEGRDAMILKVPEAPTPEPSGTWIGS